MDEKLGVAIVGRGRIAVVVFKSATMSDMDEITSIFKQISEYIKENHPEGVVVDFGCVKFFSSQVLGMLLDIRAEMEAYEGEVVISSINPQLHRIFKITNLDKVFRFFPDKESAVGAMSCGGGN